MRIAISGAQCTGKTTLMKKICSNAASELDKYTVATEIVRTLMAKGVKINKGADHESQCKILEAHYHNILNHSNLLTDRCAVDAFVYSTWDYLKGNYSFDQHKEHERIMLSCLPSYHLYFYLPVEFEMTADGVRDTDKIYQKEIHELFITIYRKYNIPYIELKGSVEERFNRFITYLK